MSVYKMNCKLDQQSTVTEKEQNVILNNCIFKNKTWDDRAGVILSEFDVKLRAAWKEALDKGCFLHGVESIPKRIPGDRGFTGLLCENRPGKKRPAHVFSNLRQPVDPNSFNFSKVSDSEKLFILNVSENNKKPVSVIVNNSPYEFGHVLLVPEIDKLHNQCMTDVSVKLGINVLLNSALPGFRVMFNSLCGGASVNHLHLHGYYTEYWLNSEVYNMFPLFEMKHQIKLNQEYCLGDCYELDAEDSIVRGFGFMITEENSDEKLPRTILKMVDYLSDNNIAHNMVFIRGEDVSRKNRISCKTTNGTSKIINKNRIFEPSNNGGPFISNDTAMYGCIKHCSSQKPNYLVGRIYLFPRKSSFKQKDYKKFLVNVTELFGHLYFGDRYLYENMTQNDIVEALQEVTLCSEKFNELKKNITLLFT